MPPAPKPIRHDATKEVQISVVSRSPHVVAYRLWFKRPGDAAWTRIGDGTTADDVPDSVTSGPFPDGTLIAYWLGIGGNANTKYRTLVIFSQEGNVLPGGTCIEEDKVDADGLAVVEGYVELTS